MPRLLLSPFLQVFNRKSWAGGSNFCPETLKGGVDRISFYSIDRVSGGKQA